MAKRKIDAPGGPIQPNEAEVYRKAVMKLELQGKVDQAFIKNSKDWRDAVRESYKELEKANQQLNILATKAQFASQAFKYLATAFAAPTVALNKLAGVVGSSGVGIEKGIQLVNNYNNQLRTLSSQFVKYGQGISGTQAQVEKLADKYKFLREETMQLMSEFEKSFDVLDPLRDMESVFDDIADSVGKNVKAMQSMMGAISGILNKSPSLEAAFGAAKDKKGFLNRAGYAMAVRGDLSISEAKKIDEYVRGGYAISKQDAETKARIDEQTRAFRNLNKFFEDMNMKIGNKLIPYVAKISKGIEFLSPFLTGFGAWMNMISAAVTAIAAALGSVPGMLRGGAAIARLVGGGTGASSGLGASLAAAVGPRLVGAAPVLGGIAGGAGGGYAGASFASWAQQKIYGRDIAREQPGWTTAGTTVAGAGTGALIGGLIGALFGAGAGAIPGAAIGGAISGGGVGYLVGTSATDDANKRFASEDALHKRTSLEIKMMKEENPAIKQELDFERNELMPLEEEMRAAREEGDEEQVRLLQIKEGELKKQLTIMQAQHKEDEAQFQLQKDKLGQLAQFTIALKTIEEVYKNQKDLLGSQYELAESMADLFGASFGSSFDGISDQLDKANEQMVNLIDSAEELLKKVDIGVAAAVKKGVTQASVMEQANDLAAEREKLVLMKAGTEEYTNKENKIKQMEIDFTELTGYQSGVFTAANKSRTDLLKSLRESSKVYDIIEKKTAREAENSAKITSLSESRMNLANSLGKGMSATVGMQMEVVKNLEKEKSVARETMRNLDEGHKNQMKMLDSKINAETNLKVKEDLIKAKNNAELEFNNKRLDQEKKLVDLTAKQAEITKSLREGYISAIQAMTTGAGVFTRIVMSQEQRLGNITFGSPRKTRALRAGSELEGRREAGRIGAGTLTEGAMSDAERQTLARYGMLGTEVGDIRKSAGTIGAFQDTTGNSMSGAMNVLQNNITGTSQVLDAHTKAVGDATTGMTTFGKAMEKTTAILPGSADLNKVFNSQDFIKNLSDALADAFKKVAEEASTKAIKELQKGR